MFREIRSTSCSLPVQIIPHLFFFVARESSMSLPQIAADARRVEVARCVDADEFFSLFLTAGVSPPLFLSGSTYESDSTYE